MTISQDQVNLPEIVAELRNLYPRYEQALIANDVDTLIALFWDTSQVMRFGVTENLYGYDELHAFRKGRPSTNLMRTVLRTDIVTFGTDFGSITLEFERDTPAGKVHGRQSQVWVRLAPGWRIVSAHVSLLPSG